VGDVWGPRPRRPLRMARNLRAVGKARSAQAPKQTQAEVRVHRTASGRLSVFTSRPFQASICNRGKIPGRIRWDTPLGLRLDERFERLHHRPDAATARNKYSCLKLRPRLLRRRLWKRQTGRIVRSCWSKNPAPISASASGTIRECSVSNRKPQ